MNPFDDWLQRLLGQQQQQPPVGPVQPQIQTQQPFSAPTPAPDPQNPFVEGLRNVMRNVGTFAAARPEMRMGRAVGDAVLDGAPQREAWNALMGQQPSFPSQNVQNMTPDQQFQVFSDVGGMVNPIAGATRLKLSGQFQEPPNNFFESLFSRLQRGIQDAPVSPKGATAKEWAGILTPKTAKGEREFTGIESLLKADPERVITKSELDELAKKKGVRFSEVEDDRYGTYIQPGDAENYRMIMLTKEPSEETIGALKPFQDAAWDADNRYQKANEMFIEADPQSNFPLYVRNPDHAIAAANYPGEPLRKERIEYYTALKNQMNANKVLLQKQEELLGIPYKSHNNVPKNTLAHLRLSDRIDPVTGQKALFVEELQSDMLQELRDYGPIQGTKAAHDAEVDRLTKIARDIRWGGPGPSEPNLNQVSFDDPFTNDPFTNFDPMEVERAFTLAKRTPDLPQPLSAKRITKKPEETFNELRAWMEDPDNRPGWRGVYTSDQIEHTIRYLKAAAEAEMVEKQVPGGQPFTKGEEWTELLLKRVLKEAVDGGYETVVLPRGEQVHNVVGGPRSAMAQYYETNVPNILKDYGKKLGVKIEMEEVPTKNFVADENYDINVDADGTLIFDPIEQTNLAFRITPDLKSAVSKGQRLWSTGAAALPGTMELLRQRNGIPKREEKKKK